MFRTMCPLSLSILSDILKIEEGGRGKKEEEKRKQREKEDGKWKGEEKEGDKLWRTNREKTSGKNG